MNERGGKKGYQDWFRDEGKAVYGGSRGNTSVGLNINRQFSL